MNTDFLKTSQQGSLTFFYDERSSNLHEIEGFLESDGVKRIAEAIGQPAYIALGGDGVFVYTAKRAFMDGLPVLGINFGTRGFLLHDQTILDKNKLSFTEQQYPLLAVNITLGIEYFEGYAFNEVYITRSGETSAIHLDISIGNSSLVKLPYVGDGLMISTPAGSTGWSRSYGGVILPHHANLHVLTPIGRITPSELDAFVVTDTHKVCITHDPDRTATVDILLDNERIISHRSEKVELTIKKSPTYARLLIEEGYMNTWEMKTYGESGFR